MRLHLVAALLLLSAVAAIPAHAASLQAVAGEARDAASGRLLYREQHLIRDDHGVPLERLVLYRCPDGNAFARKRVDYRDSRTAPGFALEDVRAGYREGLRRQGGQTLVWGGDKPAVAIAISGALVADAGFDEFLRNRWAALLSGRAQTLRFVVPAYRRALSFQLRSLGLGTVDGRAVQRFALKLDGLLGLVGPSLQVAYAADDRSLRRYDGVTNLRDDRGEQLHARIDFATPPQPASDSDWARALALPLRACRLGH